VLPEGSPSGDFLPKHVYGRDEKNPSLCVKALNSDLLSERWLRKKKEKKREKNSRLL
jgi:hypothetical protein